MPLELPAVCTWLDRARLGIAGQRDLVQRLAVRSRRRRAQPLEGRRGAPASPSAVVSGRRNSSRSSTTAPVSGSRTAKSARPKRHSRLRLRRLLLRAKGEGVQLLAREALQRGDQVGADPLRHLEVLAAQVRVDAVLPAAVAAHGHARHALDAAAPRPAPACRDITPMAAKFTACRPEPQKRLSDTPDTSHAASPRPARRCGRCSRPARPPATRSPPPRRRRPRGRCRVRSRQLVQRLGQQLLRMDLRERALARLAAPARRAHRVEDVCLAQSCFLPRLGRVG